MDSLKMNTPQLSLHRILKQALNGHNAHVDLQKALEGLKVNLTGRKILNAPYTIWQLIKHINFWQDKFLSRLEGKQNYKLAGNWMEGWEEQQNAEYQEELDREINRLHDGITKTLKLLGQEEDCSICDLDYTNKYDIVQAMGSHLSYHLGEIILLRRIFGSWREPGKDSFYGSFR